MTLLMLQENAGFDAVSMMGMPIIIALVVLIFWLVVIALAIWALITLKRIRSTQDQIEARLQSLENLLRRGE